MKRERRWVLTVPWDPNRLSKNRMGGHHWGQRSGLQKDARRAGEYAWKMAGFPVAAGRVRASIHVRRGRVMDEANIIDGLKGVLDGIFVRGLTPDDSSRWLTLGPVTQETGDAFRFRPEVVITVEEVEE